MKVYPIGTEQDPSGTRVQELMSSSNMLLIDCRINPWSWRHEWQKDALVKRWGTRYHLAGAFLGNSKHPSNQMFPGKCEIELVNPEIGIKGLMRYLKEGHDLILLCACLEYRYCHLSEVVRRLSEKVPDVEVVFPPAPMPTKGHVSVGAKVFLAQGKEHVPAVILKTGFASTGDYLLCWLRVAQRNALNGGAWLVSEVGPVQSHKLTKRGTTIPELDVLEAHYGGES
jgi:hypothetical protein